MAGWVWFRRLLGPILLVAAAVGLFAVIAIERAPAGELTTAIAALLGQVQPTGSAPNGLPAIGISPESAEPNRFATSSSLAYPGTKVGVRFPARDRGIGQQADAPLPLEFEVVGNRIDPSGEPLQTLRVTFKPGGAFSYLALALFDDERRVPELFEQARRQIPTLRNPATVNFGLAFNVEINPANTFVIAESKVESGDKVRRYSNGVVERIRPPGSGLLRVVDFPAARRIPGYQWPTEDKPVTVPAQARLIDYQHLNGADVRRLIEQAYGIYSLRAVQDFTRQTKWHPVDQPLKEGNWYRLVVSTAKPFADDPPPVVHLTGPDAAATAKLQEQAEARGRVGIYLIDRDETSHTYLVRVLDPAVRASSVSQLVYGTQDRTLDVARLAGLTIPPPPNSRGKVSFDPSLFARSFTMQVDQADEAFPYQTETRNSRRVITLLDGTVIEVPAAGGVQSGVTRFVRYPSDFRKISYRPPMVANLVLDYLLFLPQLPGYLGEIGQFDLAQRDQRIKQRAAEREKVLPQMLWTWDFEIPRNFGDVATDVRFVDTLDGRVLEATLLPRQQVGRLEAALQARVYVKLAVLSLLLGIAVVFIVGPSLVAGERRVADRYAEAAGRPEEVKL